MQRTFQSQPCRDFEAEGSLRLLWLVLFALCTQDSFYRLGLPILSSMDHANAWGLGRMGRLEMRRTLNTGPLEDIQPE